MSHRCLRFVHAPLLFALALVLAACQTTSTTIGPDGKPMPVDADRKPADNAERARLRLELAASYFGRGQPTTALEEVNQALAIDPNLGDAYNLRGLIYSSTNDDVHAEESFRRALQINPRDADTMHNFGWYFCQRQRYVEAGQYFAQALAVPTYRGQQRTLLAEGVCEARAGQNGNAEVTLMRAYEMDPRNPSVAINLSEILLRNGQYERARFYVRRVNSQPELVTAQTLWLAARVEKRLGNEQGARDFGNQLRGRFPQSPEAQAFENGRFNE